MISLDISELVRVLIPAAAAFMIGMAGTPFLAHYLYKYKAWKKTPGKTALDGTAAAVFNHLHEKHETRAPRMGGIVVWGSVAIAAFGIALFGTPEFNFVSRSQTWIPLATLIIGSLVGLADDIAVVRLNGNGRGVSLYLRLALVVVLSTFVGWWFYDKLDVATVNIPFSSPLELGVLIMPLFILISLALYASGVIDGIDGLSGGVFASIFAAYAVIAFAQQQIDLAAFCASVVGGLLAFLWFNIPPARFYMSDTGTMGLTLTLAAVAFMTDSLSGGVGLAVLPVVGGLLVLTVASNILQVVWKKAFGRKLFLVAPLHHHFEALGWPGYKVTMRYWVLSAVLAFVGVILALISV